MTTYAFIFARGGSKGVPRKNIKLLAGKPLIEYSIDIAKQVKQIDKLFVSTEDEEISEISRAAGAEIIPRPAELAADDSREWLSWRHAVEYVSAKYGDFDLFISLPATSPLRIALDVESAISRFDEDRADICISITPASRNPYFNMVKMNDQNFYELVCRPSGELFRRQDAPTVYDMTTVVYVTSPEYIMKSMGHFEGNVSAIVVPKERAVDIDDMIDFRLAETLLHSRGIN